MKQLKVIKGSTPESHPLLSGQPASSPLLLQASSARQFHPQRPSTLTYTLPMFMRQCSLIYGSFPDSCIHLGLPVRYLEDEASADAEVSPRR